MVDLPRCVVCRRNVLVSVLQQDRKVCDDCARKTGNIVIPPPRRRAAPCARCNHSKIVRAIPRELTMIHTANGPEPTFGPMFAAYEIRTPDGRVQPVHARSGFGVFEAYICKACGFTEWYCQDPQEIPIGPEYMTEELDTDGPSPFR